MFVVYDNKVVDIAIPDSDNLQRRRKKQNLITVKQEEIQLS